MTSEIQQVDVDDLEYDHENDLFLHEGEPFTGESLERNSEGTVVDLATYSSGVEHGEQKSWHQNGQLKSEGSMEYGMACRTWKRWHSNGQPAEETGFDDFGKRIYIKEWNNKGDLARSKEFRNPRDFSINPEIHD